MSKKYELTKERILAMADECEDVKRVLKRAFPDAFKGEWVTLRPERDYIVELCPHGALAYMTLIDRNTQERFARISIVSGTAGYYEMLNDNYRIEELPEFFSPPEYGVGLFEVYKKQ